MKPIVPAYRTGKVTYAIRDLDEEAKRIEAHGTPVLRLSIGDPIPSGFSTPTHMVEAVVSALRENRNGYVDSSGVKEARVAISRECEQRGIRATEEDVLLTPGVSGGMWLALTALANSGENVLTPSPNYPQYSGVIHLNGAFPNFYRTSEENGWQPDVHDIERRIGDKTRAIIVNNPNNPTGALYPNEVLADILGIARRKNLVVLADEVYSRTIFDGKTHTPMAALADDVPILTFDGFSKGYLAPGWRMASIVFSGPKSVLKDYKDAVYQVSRLNVCSPGPPQYSIEHALTGSQDHIAEMNAKLQSRRDFTHRRLNEIRGISCTKPEGGFYAFPGIEFSVGNDRDFVLDLLRKKHVLVVHGTGFDYPPPGSDSNKKHFRVVFLQDEKVLEDGLGRLDEYMRELYT